MSRKKNWVKPTYSLEPPKTPGGHYYIRMDPSFEIPEKNIRYTGDVLFMMVKKSEEPIVKVVTENEPKRCLQKNLEALYLCFAKDREARSTLPNSLKDEEWE